MQSEEHFNCAVAGAIAISYNILRTNDIKDHNTIFDILNKIAKYLTEVGILAEPVRIYFYDQILKDIREYNFSLNG